MRPLQLGAVSVVVHRVADIPVDVGDLLPWEIDLQAQVDAGVANERIERSKSHLGIGFSIDRDDYPQRRLSSS
jgi:hypothetical protein